MIDGMKELRIGPPPCALPSTTKPGGEFDANSNSTRIIIAALVAATHRAAHSNH
jgi:hypothetical protein